MRGSKRILMLKSTIESDEDFIYDQRWLSCIRLSSILMLGCDDVHYHFVSIPTLVLSHTQGVRSQKSGDLCKRYIDFGRTR